MVYSLRLLCLVGTVNTNKTNANEKLQHANNSNPDKLINFYSILVNEQM